MSVYRVKEDEMRFIWRDYDKFDKSVVEEWLDDEARRTTGIDGSFEELYRYWLDKSDTTVENELWCKVVFRADKAVAALLIGCHKGEFTLSEFIVDPMLRGKGIGTAVLTELIKHSVYILGKDITFVKAVIFPDNEASKRAFEKSGFNYDSTHPDGDSMYYVHRKELKQC